MPGLGVEWLQAPIVEDQEIDLAEAAADAGVSPVASRQRQFSKQLRHALVEHRAVVAAGFMAQRAGQPALAHAGWPTDYQIVVPIDPIARHEFLEQRPVEPAGGAVIDILHQRVLPQFCMAQPGAKLLVVPVGNLPAEQQRQPFRVGECGSFGRGFGFAKSLGHAEQPQLVKLVEGGVGEHQNLLNDNSPRRGCYGGRSPGRRRRAEEGPDDRDCCPRWI